MGDMGLSVESRRCEKCKGEGYVGGYFEKGACTCCREGGCGESTGCGCWHQGKECSQCHGTGERS